MINRYAPTILGLAAAAVVAVLIIGQVTKDDSYTVYAKFNDAGGILHNYNVKIGGVAAGKITGISLDKQDHAVLKMSIDKSAAPIGAGATAKVRPVNLLGEKYIDLDPGDLSHPMPEGSTIPTSRTSIPVELDDVINIIDPDTRAALRLLINEAGVAMAGRGTDFNATLDELPRALDSANRFVSDIDKENKKLEQAIVSGDKVIRSVNAGRDDFANLVGSAADAMTTVAQRRAKLGETVRSAPAALNQLRTTLSGLQNASTQLTPAARDLRATAPSLADTLDRAPQFAKDAKATLATATRVAPQLSKLGRQSTPTIKLLRPTSDRLDRFTSEFQPFLTTLDEKRGFIDFLGFVDGWTGVTDGADGFGHHFRIHASLDTDLISGLFARYAGVNIPPAKKKAGRQAPSKAKLPSLPTSSGGGQTPSTKPKLPSLPIKPVTDALDKGLQDVGSSVQDAVGGLVGGLTGKRRDTGSGSSTSDTTKLFNYLLGP